MSDTPPDAVADPPANQRRHLEERLLSEHAYAQRRAMLVMAALTFAISWGGVRLSSIDALGLEITTWNERYLLAFAAVVLAYLIGNFATLVQPVMVAWAADVEAFKVTVNRTVQAAAAQMHSGLADLRKALTDAGMSGDAVDEFLALSTKFDSQLDADLPKAAARYLALHEARLRFEYRVPVGISLFVLFLVVPRILVLS